MPEREGDCELSEQGSHEQLQAYLVSYLKCLQQAALDKGDWALGWSYTNLPQLESTSRVRRGGAHPVEQAAGMAYLKELRTLEDWREGKRGGGTAPAGGETR